MKIKFYGAWYYRVSADTLRRAMKGELEDAPGESWNLVYMIPGKHSEPPKSFDYFEESGYTRPNLVLLGQGDNALLFDKA